MTPGPSKPLGINPTQLHDHQIPGSAGMAAVAADPADSPPLSRARLWTHRLAVLLFVFFCAVLGVVLVVFPWRDEWTNNSLLVGYPTLQNLAAHGFVRGVCSGLGLLDIWIGFWEAIHYHE